MFKNKKGKMGAESVLIFLAIGVLSMIILESFGVTNLGTVFSAQQIPTGGDDGTVITVDAGNTAASTATIFDNTNVLARATAPDQYTRVFLKNAVGLKDKGLVAEGGSLTLAPDDEVIIYHAENSTGTSDGYYTYKVEKTMPDKGAYTFEGQLYQMDSGVSMNYDNDDGSVNTAQAMTADDVYIFDLTFKSSSKKAFGNPQLGDMGKKNVACFHSNSTVIDSMDVLVSGASVGVASIPKVVATNLTADGNIDSAWCFNMPVIKNTGKWMPQLLVETTSTQPTTIDSINVSIHDVDYDLDGDDYTEIIGVEDEDKNSLGIVGGVWMTPIDIS